MLGSINLNMTFSELNSGLKFTLPSHRVFQLGNTTVLQPGKHLVVHGDIITVTLDWTPSSNIKPGQTVYLR